MAPEIWDQRFWSYRKPGWHYLGTVSEEERTATEVFEEIGANYEIYLTPAAALLEYDDGTFEYVPTDKRCIMREPTNDDPIWRCFGIVGGDYEVVQNRDIAGMLDYLIDPWRLETVGVLYEGRTVFATFHTDPLSVKGDEVIPYFLFTDTRSGGDAMTLAHTPVRTECANTLRLALRAAVVSVLMGHYMNVSKRLDYRMKLLAQMAKATETSFELFNRLASAVVTDDIVNDVFAKAYPYPSKPRAVAAVEGLLESDIEDNPDLLNPLLMDAANSEATWEYRKSRMDAYRELSWDRFTNMNATTPSVSGTLWSAYNAVCEVADYRTGQDSYIASALWGARSREKERAMTACSEWADVL